MWALINSVVYGGYIFIGNIDLSEILILTQTFNFFFIETVDNGMKIVLFTQWNSNCSLFFWIEVYTVIISTRSSVG